MKIVFGKIADRASVHTLIIVFCREYVNSSSEGFAIAYLIVGSKAVRPLIRTIDSEAVLLALAAGLHSFQRFCLDRVRLRTYWNQVGLAS